MVQIQDTQKSILFVSTYYFVQENVKKLESFLAAEILTDMFFV